MGIGPTLLGSGSPLTPKSIRSVADLAQFVSNHSSTYTLSLIGFSCSGLPTWKRLISRPVTTHECIPLLTAIFLDKNEARVIQSLCGDDAQVFIDMIDEVPPHALSSWKKWPLIQT